jgi:valyl-tRNA synthetase
LIHVLESLLRALHPLAPFITEEIWQRVKVSRRRRRRDHHARAFPKPEPIDSAAEPEMRWVMSFIEGVRQIRGEMDIAPSRKLEVLLQNCGPLDSEYGRATCPI